MNHLVEYIGGEGVHTTDLQAIRSRLNNPQPGDVVDFREFKGAYPYRSPFGTIEQQGGGFVKPDEFHICCQPGSIFLGWNSEKRAPFVSISGGPFAAVHMTQLEWSGEFRQQFMWNWGDHSPGAHQGVEYYIMRPVFILKKL